MTERCGRLYDGDKRCGWFAGHDGPCGPWKVPAPPSREDDEREARRLMGCE